MSRADVFIQAGHEGRTTGSTGAAGPLGNEIEWTPIVADEATRILREGGVDVVRAPAAIKGDYTVKVAVFIHFDGSTPPCKSGASIGYKGESDQPAALAWKALYGKYWPFRWMRDNFTANLSGYYGFGYTQTTDAEFVMELGEITCREQAEWLKPRLKWLGHLIAHFLSQRIGKGDVPDPGPFGEVKGAPAWLTCYAGLTMQGYPIPRKGLSNPTLLKTLKIEIEPLGEVITYDHKEFVKGKVSWFGGPTDDGMGPDATVALTGELAQELSEDDYYVAMRWDYRTQKKFWVNRHLLVINPANGRAVIVRAIDWGPHISTGRVLDLSHKTLTYLGVQTDGELICAFSNTTNETHEVGPISS